jgi:hypothetical protein
MLKYLRKLFGFGPFEAAPAKVEAAPYKVETPVTQPVVAPVIAKIEPVTEVKAKTAKSKAHAAPKAKAPAKDKEATPKKPRATKPKMTVSK